MKGASLLGRLRASVSSRVGSSGILKAVAWGLAET